METLNDKVDYRTPVVTRGQISDRQVHGRTSDGGRKKLKSAGVTMQLFFIVQVFWSFDFSRIVRLSVHLGSG